MTMELSQGNILDLDVDVVVNAANTELQHAGSLAAAIADEGGPSIQAESNAIGWCDLGSAVATGGGKLRARHVIHVPTVDYTRGRRASLEDVAQGTKAAIELARSLGAKTIAFPLLGAGIVGLNAADVVRTMRTAMTNSEDMRIIICVHWQGDWPAVERAFGAAS